MPWPTGDPTAPTDWEQVATIAPEPMAALGALIEAAWSEADPQALELARVRIAMLLGNHAELTRRGPRGRASGVTDEQVRSVASWPDSPLFDARHRACLALTEQFVIDANGVTTAEAQAVADHLGPEGCYAFVAAVSVLETFQRACLVLGVETIPEDWS